MDRPPPRFSAGIKALGLFWLVLLLAGGAGATWLHILGPPAPQRAEAPAAEEATTAAAPTVTARPASPEPPPLPTLPPVVAPPVAGPGGPSLQPAPVPEAPRPPGPAVAEPDPALIERLRDGSLPRIAEDGRAPWRTYARPFDQADRRPRIGILVAGLGISESLTEQVIQRLPGAVTLAFSPYGLRLAEFAALARADGHEVLVGVPMEPVGFPLNDPGPYALLTSLPWGDNSQRLTWVLSRFPGYVGATNVLGPTLRGERFSASPESMRPFLEVLRARGLLFVEARPGEAPPQGLPARSVDVLIDERPMRAEIDLRLAELERIARERGAALGLSAASPLAIERLAAWTANVESRGFALAPVSALASPQGRQAQR
jgi:polysaccharide deacetylase 2 family uncharacterized protein YibQ